MSRLLAAALAAIFAAGLLAPAAAMADDGVKLNVTQVDASDFPNVRIVASAVDAQGKPVKGLQATDLIVSESPRSPSPSCSTRRAAWPGSRSATRRPR